MFFRQSKMENRFQSKTSEDDVVGQLQQNNKRPSMSLSMGGLWDVVPRLDHYRYSYKLIKLHYITYQINYILFLIVQITLYVLLRKTNLKEKKFLIAKFGIKFIVLRSIVAIT